MIFQNIHTQSSFSKQHNFAASKAVLMMPKKEGDKNANRYKSILVSENILYKLDHSLLSVGV